MIQRFFNPNRPEFLITLILAALIFVENVDQSTIPKKEVAYTATVETSGETKKTINSGSGSSTVEEQAKDQYSFSDSQINSIISNYDTSNIDIESIKIENCIKTITICNGEPAKVCNSDAEVVCKIDCIDLLNSIDFFLSTTSNENKKNKVRAITDCEPDKLELILNAI